MTVAGFWRDTFAVNVRCCGTICLCPAWTPVSWLCTERLGLRALELLFLSCKILYKAFFYYLLWCIVRRKLASGWCYLLVWRRTWMSFHRHIVARRCGIHTEWGERMCVCVYGLHARWLTSQKDNLCFCQTWLIVELTRNLHHVSLRSLFSCCKHPLGRRSFKGELVSILLYGRLQLRKIEDRRSGKNTQIEQSQICHPHRAYVFYRRNTQESRTLSNRYTSLQTQESESDPQCTTWPIMSNATPRRPI